MKGTQGGGMSKLKGPWTDIFGQGGGENIIEEEGHWDV